MMNKYISELLYNISKYATKAERDILVKINLSAISEVPLQGEDKKQFYQKLTERANAGEGIFTKETLDWIERLPEDAFPQNNRKGYTKWLANRYTTEKHNIVQGELSQIKDWYQANYQTINLDDMKFAYALLSSDEWHNQLNEKEGPELGEDSPYVDDNPENIFLQFPDGWKVVYVPAAGEIEPWRGMRNTSNDRVVEGDFMGICLGSASRFYQDNRSGYIYSLRDPSNYPHVTMRVDNGILREEKGKGNSVPAEKYLKYIDAFYEKIQIKSKRTVAKQAVSKGDSIPESVEGRLEFIIDYFLHEDSEGEMKKLFEIDEDDLDSVANSSILEAYPIFFPKDVAFAQYLCDLPASIFTIMNLAIEYPYLRTEAVRRDCMNDSYGALFWAKIIDTKPTEDTIIGVFTSDSEVNNPKENMKSYIEFFSDKDTQSKMKLAELMFAVAEKHKISSIYEMMQDTGLAEYVDNFYPDTEDENEYEE